MAKASEETGTHSSFVVGAEWRVGRAPSPPSSGKLAVESAGPGQHPRGVAGTWGYLGPYGSAANHGNAGTGPG